MIYRITKVLLVAVLKLFFRFGVKGRENIPPRGGFIIASNHASFFDPPIIGCAFSRPTGFLAKRELFDNAFLRWYLPKVNTIPVNRGSFDIKALRRTIQEIAEGRGMLVFPEGTRTTDGELKEPEKGIGFLVDRCQAPVIPAYIGGTFEVFPKGAKRLKLAPIRVKIGVPLYFNREERDPRKGDRSDRYKDIGNKIMKEIAFLKESAW